ncbi:MAG TPA: hypothetical protein VFP10_02195, partial [Candidatus Eisenbacteria bacterium]|nr:hypothetical protein [Candidatus Eisenbacteria bacterium]
MVPASAARILLLVLVLFPMACATSREGGSSSPSWPYASVAVVNSVPPELVGRPIFNGRWIVADPVRGTVIAESSEPRYLLRLSTADPQHIDFLDLGMQASAENVIFADRGRTALLVGSVGSRTSGISVDARSVLKMD